jgi:hypothetical protein
MPPFLKYLLVACNVACNRVKNEREQRRDYYIRLLQYNVSNRLKKKVHRNYSNKSVLGNVTNLFKPQFQLDYTTYKESEYVNSVKVMCSKETLRSVKISHVYSLLVHNEHIISEIMQRVTLKIHIENPTRGNSVSKFYFIFI